ncbi:tumor necrosis factor ligand superfamily member 15-like isoform X1 [Scleropages formosus]|uniref:tumor necrosis factor ligand superfamily member 15-like isoform X1 n=1 Tax=Scleropages formosus TaxID=113540 RepID=UPI0010FA9EF2|nr:tumor necrosis factor ligand superfamily member 15-like isoform X1 [Scleropages formosus]
MGRHERQSNEEDSVVLQVKHDPAVLVLMDHCREMKRQECRLRVATAFLLLGCAALFLVSSRLGRLPSDTVKHSVEPRIAEFEGVSQRQTSEYPVKPSAHLTAPCALSQPHVIHWNDNQAIIQGFKYKEGELIVPQSGKYHVYLQITFRKPESYNCSEGDLFIPLRPEVRVWQDSYPEYVPLMSASDYLSCKEIFEKSIYTAGMYDLEKNSKLQVWYGADKELAVQTDEQKIFFGAFLV